MSYDTGHYLPGASMPGGWDNNGLVLGGGGIPDSTCPLV